MNRVIHLFGDLSATRQGPALRREGRLWPIFLRQSSIDSACGAHSLFMALLALRVFHRDALLHGEGPHARLAARLKARARRFHFTGTPQSGLLWILKEVSDRVTYHRLRPSEIAAGAAQRIRDGQLMVLGIGYARPRLDHWVLVVGFAGQQTKNGLFHTSEFLVLDPDTDLSLDSAWNCSIVRGSAKALHNAWLMIDGVDMSRITLSSAIVLGLKQTAIKSPVSNHYR